MPYFVIGDDGQKYGPADVATLNQWIAENRLLRTQILEDEASGNRMAASAVQGLNFPVAQAGPAPGPAQGPLPGSHGYSGAYARPGGYVADDGSGDVKAAWIFGAFGLVCCGPLSIVGIVKANQAQAKGNLSAAGPKILSIIALVLWIVWLGFFAYRVSKGGLVPTTTVSTTTTTTGG